MPAPGDPESLEKETLEASLGAPEVAGRGKRAEQQDTLALGQKREEL